ncbi:sigma 54-interacting transcriptional regulator [Ruminococcaceae bacterium OttesenSCG-928-D13]|nr:sigma 54-interacting transcriptional regulator [Ruminococcaceae bacterium OttesenSCG-928-D13]
MNRTEGGMKKLAIFYRDRFNQAAILYIQNNLYSVLGEYVDITTYYLNEMEETQAIQADAYLVLYEEMLSCLVRHINDFSKVVVVVRSIQRKYLQPVLEIPTGTDVLVINDSRESCLQTVSLIYELGVGHLNLLPYDGELMEQGAYNNVYTAIITQDMEHLVPKHIRHVCNIYNREVSFETFQKLIAILDLENPVVQRNLMRKIDDDMDPGINFRTSYLSNFLKDQLLTNVIENFYQAILLMDKSGLLHYVNEKANNSLHLKSGDDFSKSPLYSEALLARPDFKDELVRFEGENYLVEKKSIVLLNEVIGHCLILQNENDLRNTEVNLNQQLKKRGLYAKHNFEDITHASAVMGQCISVAKRVAPSDYTILVRGESGTGKELLAQSIHNYSLRKNAPFVAINCAALPESLLESELFGYAPGAFTGAQKNGKVGLFEHAQHGTIFLDEIGDISTNLQPRLLRVIQERQIMKVGSDKIIDVDVRIIAATNVDLEGRIAEGKFRVDLFHRLNVIALNIAPLRERREDILPLLERFLGRIYGSITPAEQRVLMAYDWPGNVREVENVAAYYRILGALPDHFSGAAPKPSAAVPCGAPAAPPVRGEAALEHLVLALVAEASGAFHGIGRSAIRLKLAEQGVAIGEGRLRKALEKLQDMGYIKANLGRLGSQVTPLGRDALVRQGEAPCSAPGGGGPGA